VNDASSCGPAIAATLEFKRGFSFPEGALCTIVAFANTSGGALLIGVEGRSR